jgi:hypothetical protein
MVTMRLGQSRSRCKWQLPPRRRRPLAASGALAEAAYAPPQACSAGEDVPDRGLAPGRLSATVSPPPACRPRHGGT